MFKKFYNSKYTQIGLYIIAVAAIIISINAFIDNVPYFFCLVIDKIGWVLHASKPIVIAIVLAYLLDPLVDIVEKILLKVKYLKKKEKTCRGISVVLVVLFLLIVISTIISVLIFSITDTVKVASFDDIFVIVNQYRDMLNDLYYKAMDALARANIESAEIQEYITEASGAVVSWLSQGAQDAIRYISNISTFITNLVVAFVIMIYLLTDGKRIIGYIKKVSYALLNDKQNKRIKGLVRDADTVFSGFIRGQFADAFVMMILVSIGLSFIGVDFAILIAVLTGIGNLIPYVGPIVAYGGVIISSIISGDMRTFIIAMLFLFVIQLIDGNVIGPKLLSNSVEIHPMLVVIFILFGSAIGGLLGMLLAVPVGAFIKVLVVRFIDKKVEEKNQLKSVHKSKI